MILVRTLTFFIALAFIHTGTKPVSSGHPKRNNQSVTFHGNWSPVTDTPQGLTSEHPYENQGEAPGVDRPPNTRTNQYETIDDNMSSVTVITPASTRQYETIDDLVTTSGVNDSPSAPQGMEPTNIYSRARPVASPDETNDGMMTAAGVYDSPSSQDVEPPNIYNRPRTVASPDKTNGDLLPPSGVYDSPSAQDMEPPNIYNRPRPVASPADNHVTSGPYGNVSGPHGGNSHADLEAAPRVTTVTSLPAGNYANVALPPGTEVKPNQTLTGKAYENVDVI